jgi:hypothetical protein
MEKETFRWKNIPGIYATSATFALQVFPSRCRRGFLHN